MREERIAPWEMDLAERVTVARRLGAAGLNPAEIADLLRVKPQTVRKYLRAGACPDCGGPVVNPHPRRCQGCAAKRAHRPAWTQEEIVAALKEWAAEHGAPPSLEDWVPVADRSRQWGREYPRWPTHTQVQGAFGTWSAALEAAGFGVRNPTWDRESILASFHAFARRHGRSPTVAELRGGGRELPSRPTITHYFGSLDALRAELGLTGARVGPKEWLPPVNQRWDRERIVAAIKTFAAEHGRAPTTTDWKRTGAEHPDPETVSRHFGSFAAGLAAAGFVTRRLSWGREEIIAAINVHLREHGELPTSGEWLRRDPAGKRPAVHNVRELFGSWDNAIEAAGHRVERWDRETILEALRELGRELGRRPKRRDIVPKRPGLPGYDTVAAQFGSLIAALEGAGFTPVARRWTREETIEALRAWASEYGRPPGYKDWSRGSDGHPGTSTVEKLFGSWTEALLAVGLPIVKRNWDRESILVALRAWTDEHGRAPSSVDWHGADPSGQRPAVFRVQREFGTWAAALRAAGLPSANRPSTVRGR